MGRWAEAFQASMASHDTADTVDTSSGEPATGRPCVSSVNSVTRQEGATPQQTGSPSDLVSTVSAVSRSTTKAVDAGALDIQSAAVAAWCERRAAEALDGYEPQPTPPEWRGAPPDRRRLSPRRASAPAVMVAARGASPGTGRHLLLLRRSTLVVGIGGSARLALLHMPPAGSPAGQYH
jgi:hypothetical protein